MRLGLWKRGGSGETRHRDDWRSKLLMMISVGGRGQLSSGAEVPDFCMTA